MEIRPKRFVLSYQNTTKGLSQLPSYGMHLEQRLPSQVLGWNVSSEKAEPNLRKEVQHTAGIDLLYLLLAASEKQSIQVP
jgi:hypothetical protein